MPDQRPYRGIIKDGKEWVKGHLYKDEFSAWILIREGVQLCPDTVNGPAEYDYEVAWVEVIPETVGQSTGRRDRDNIEIFADDVMEFHDASVCKGTDPMKRQVVKWNKSQCKYEGCFNGGIVIGTIHDHLLKGEKPCQT